MGELLIRGMDEGIRGILLYAKTAVNTSITKYNELKLTRLTINAKRSFG